MRLLFLFTLVIATASPLFGEVFAQSENQNNPDNSATTTQVAAQIATTTAIDPALETAPAVAAGSAGGQWYRSEQLTGNIEVGDFLVGPGRAEVEVAPGETIVQEISVSNRISDNRTFKLEVEDIVGSADGSQAVALTGQAEGPFSVRDYISFPEDEFTLALGERARIPVTITIPPNVSPGGYYGSVLVSTVRSPQGDDTNMAPTSPIIARVGSLFFIRVTGEVDMNAEVLEIDTLDNKLWYEEGPIDLAILTENQGTVHVNPYGELSITNMFGEEVGYVQIEPWFVLPKSLRVREITWDREFLLGRYTATAKINRGYDDIVDEVSVSFWVLPWKIVGGIFIGLFILIFVIRAFFRTFEFKRKR